MQRPSGISFRLLTDRRVETDCNKRSASGNDSQWRSCLRPQMAPCPALWKRQSNAMRWPWVSCLSASRSRRPSWSSFAEVVLLRTLPKNSLIRSPNPDPWESSSRMRLLMMAVFWMFVAGMREPCSMLGLHMLEAHFLPLHRIGGVMFRRWGGGILPRFWAMGNPSDRLDPGNKDSCWGLLREHLSLPLWGSWEHPAALLEAG